MRGRVVEIKVVLLHVFAMIALMGIEAEHAFLQDRITSIPKGKRETQILMTVADAGDAIFIPAVSARSRLIVREVAPRIAVFAVILADGTPCTFRDVWPPAIPVALLMLIHFQADTFAGVVDIHDGLLDSEVTR